MSTLALWIATHAQAHAESRVVITTAEAVQTVSLDSTPMVPSNGGTRFLQSYVSAGHHTVVVVDMTGSTAYTGQLEIPSGTHDVAYLWSRSQGVSGATPGAPSVASSTPSPAPPPAPAQTVDTSGSDSRDPSGPHDDHSSSTTSNHLGSAVLDAAAQATGVAPVLAVGGAVASGVSNFVGSSQAGLSLGGPAPDARQGKPTPTAAIVGTVRVHNTSTHALTPYVDGQQLTPIAGGAVAEFKLAAGNPRVQFFDAGALVQQGTLRVDPNVSFGLEVSTTDVHSTDRPWVWASP